MDDVVADEATELPAPAPAAVGTKRGYERKEGQCDVMIEKRYKCNYWEDPDYEWQLQRWSSRLAQLAALDNDCERWAASRRARAPATPP